MANINSTITYNANLSAAQAQIKALTGQIGALSAAFNTLDKSALSAQRRLADTFAAGVGQIGGFTARTVKATDAVEDFGKQIAANRLTMRQYFREAINGYTRQDSLMRRLAEQQVRYQQSVAVPIGAGQSMILTPQNINMASNAAALASQRFSIFNKLMGDGATAMLNWGKNTQWAGRQLMVGFTVPLMLFGALASKQFRELDKELTRFQKVYGSDLGNAISESTTSMKEQVQSLAFEISRTYGIAAKETAALAADIAATGKEGQELIGAVQQTTRLAVLGEVDRQEAMKATLALQSAFKMNTNELAESINFLNAVENQTSATLEDLATAIPKVGPVVRSLGGDVKDLATLLVAMREGGIPAAEAANALKSGLASLINPTKQASQVAKQFGVDLVGIVEANRGQLMPTIYAMQSALSSLDSFSRSRIIEQIFGKYQFARITALFDNIGRVGSQTQSVVELASKSTLELASVANQEIKILTESTAVRFQRTLEELKNAIMPIGQAMTETLIPVFKYLGEGIRAFSSFFQGLPDPIKNFGKLVVAGTALIGPLVMIVGLFGNLIANGIKFGMMVTRLGARMAGLKIEKFELLDEHLMAAKFGVDKLTTSFDTQEKALSRLTGVLSTYEASLRRLTQSSPALFIPGAIPGAGTGRSAPPPIRRQKGSTAPEKVPGGYGGGDRIPALLEPGESVINKEATSRYWPFIEAMNQGNLPGFATGVTFLGMARRYQDLKKAKELRERLSATNLEATTGRFSRLPVTDTGARVSSIGGRSSSIPGMNGVYEKDGVKYVIKTHDSADSALAEIRGSQLTREVFGLNTPIQELIKIKHPVTGDIVFAVRSPYEARFASTTGRIEEKDFFSQALAAILRRDKDLQPDNLYGNIVTDVGSAFVANKASQPRIIGGDIPSIIDQAEVNFLLRKGGAKRWFAEETAVLAKSMTEEQYVNGFKSAIAQASSKIRGAIDKLPYLDETEKNLYMRLVSDLKDAERIDWKTIYQFHKNIVPEIKRPPTATALAKKQAEEAEKARQRGEMAPWDYGLPLTFNTGGPLPGYGGGDKIPALLEPGEFVVRKEMAHKHKAFLHELNQGRVRGFVEGTPLEDLSDVGRWSRPGSFSRAISEETSSDIDRRINILIDELIQRGGITSSESTIPRGSLSQADLAHIMPTFTGEGETRRKIFNQNNLIVSSGAENNGLNFMFGSRNSKNRKIMISAIIDAFGDTDDFRRIFGVPVRSTDSRGRGEIPINGRSVPVYDVDPDSFRHPSSSRDILYMNAILSRFTDPQTGGFVLPLSGPTRSLWAPVVSAIFDEKSAAIRGETIRGRSPLFGLPEIIGNVGRTGPVGPPLSGSVPTSMARPSGTGPRPVVATASGPMGVQPGELFVPPRRYADNGAIIGPDGSVSPLPRNPLLDRLAQRGGRVGPDFPGNAEEFGRRTRLTLGNDPRFPGSPAAFVSQFSGPLQEETEQAKQNRSMIRGQAAMNLAFGLSMATSGVSMLGGQSSETANKLMVFSTALSVAIMTLQAMQGFGIGGKLVGGVKAAGGGIAKVGGMLSNVGGGAGIIGRLGGLLSAGGGALAGGGTAAALTLGGIGAAVTAVGVSLYLYKKSLNEVRDRAMAAFQDPVKTVEFFGKSIENVNETLKGFQLTDMQKDLDGVNDQLQEAVKEDYATLISKIQTSAVGVGASNLADAYNQMLISGLTAEEALESIKAIAVESGTAGGAAYAKAFGDGLLNSEDPEQAFKKLIDSIDPTSEFFQNREAALQKEINDLRAQANPIYPIGATGYYRGGATAGYNSRTLDQMGSIQEEMGVSGAAVFSAIKASMQMIDTNPELVAESAAKIRDAYLSLSTEGGGFFGIGESDQELAYDSFKNMMGELNDPQINKIMDSLQNANPEAQALAMELVSVGGSLIEAADSSDVFNESLAKAAIENVKRLRQLEEAVVDAREELSAISENSEMQKLIDLEEEALKKLIDKQERFSKKRDRLREEQQDSFEENQSAIEDEIELLNDQQEAIDKTADAYIDSLEKRSEAESFYLQQKRTAFSALEKLASGDVFGFLQERESISAASQEFSIDQQIRDIEERRDLEINAIQDQIDAKEELMDLNAEAHQIAMDNFDKETQKQADALQEQIDRQRTHVGDMNTFQDQIAEGQIVSYARIREAFGDHLAEQYKLEFNQLMRSTAASLSAQVALGRITAKEAENELLQLHRGFFPIISGTPGAVQGAAFSYSQLASIYTLPTTLGGRDPLNPGSGYYSPGNNTGSSTGQPTSPPPPAQYAGDYWPNEQNPTHQWNPNGGQNRKGAYEPVASPFNPETRANGGPINFSNGGGGKVTGPGGPKSDVIPALLSNGEYVIQASSVSKYGKSMMDTINAGKFATGGPISADRAEYQTSQRPTYYGGTPTYTSGYNKPEPTYFGGTPTSTTGYNKPRVRRSDLINLESIGYNPEDPTGIKGLIDVVRIAGATIFDSFFAPFRVPARALGMNPADTTAGGRFIGGDSYVNSDAYTRGLMAAGVVPFGGIGRQGLIDKGIPSGNVTNIDKLLLEQVGPQLGSMPGATFRGKDGVLRYVKSPETTEGAFYEHLTSRMYRSLGIPFAKTRLLRVPADKEIIPFGRYPGNTESLFSPLSRNIQADDGHRTLIASDILPGKTMDDLLEIKPGAEGALEKLFLRNQAADQLLGLTDVHGGNIIYDPKTKTLYRIDAGGNLFTNAYGKINTNDLVNTIMPNEFTNNIPDQRSFTLLSKRIQELGGIEALVKPILSSASRSSGLRPADPKFISETYAKRMQSLLDISNFSGREAISWPTNFADGGIVRAANGTYVSADRAEYQASQRPTYSGGTPTYSGGTPTYSGGYKTSGYQAFSKNRDKTRVQTFQDANWSWDGSKWTRLSDVRTGAAAQGFGLIAQGIGQSIDQNGFWGTLSAMASHIKENPEELIPFVGSSRIDTSTQEGKDMFAATSLLDILSVIPGMTGVAALGRAGMSLGRVGMATAPRIQSAFAPRLTVHAMSDETVAAREFLPYEGNLIDTPSTYLPEPPSAIHVDPRMLAAQRRAEYNKTSMAARPKTGLVDFSEGDAFWQAENGLEIKYHVSGGDYSGPGVVATVKKPATVYEYPLIKSEAEIFLESIDSGIIGEIVTSRTPGFSIDNITEAGMTRRVAGEGEGGQLGLFDITHRSPQLTYLVGNPSYSSYVLSLLSNASLSTKARFGETLFADTSLSADSARLVDRFMNSGAFRTPGYRQYNNMDASDYSDYTIPGPYSMQGSGYSISQTSPSSMRFFSAAARQILRSTAPERPIKFTMPITGETLEFRNKQDLEMFLNQFNRIPGLKNGGIVRAANGTYVSADQAERRATGKYLGGKGYKQYFGGTPTYTPGYSSTTPISAEQKFINTFSPSPLQRNYTGQIQSDHSTLTPDLINSFISQTFTPDFILSQLPPSSRNLTDEQKNDLFNSIYSKPINIIKPENLPEDMQNQNTTLGPRKASELGGWASADGLWIMNHSELKMSDILSTIIHEFGHNLNRNLEQYAPTAFASSNFSQNEEKYAAAEEASAVLWGPRVEDRLYEQFGIEFPERKNEQYRYGSMNYGDSFARHGLTQLVMSRLLGSQGGSKASTRYNRMMNNWYRSAINEQNLFRDRVFSSQYYLEYSRLLGSNVLNMSSEKALMIGGAYNNRRDLPPVNREIPEALRALGNPEFFAYWSATPEDKKFIEQISPGFVKKYQEAIGKKEEELILQEIQLRMQSVFFDNAIKRAEGGLASLDENLLNQEGVSLSTAQNAVNSIYNGGWPASLMRLAFAIAMRESNGNPTAFSRYSATNSDTGLFQVNEAAYGSQPWFNIDRLKDGTYNAQVAYQHVSKGGTDFLPWALTSGYDGENGWDWSYYANSQVFAPGTNARNETIRRTNLFWNAFKGFSGNPNGNTAETQATEGKDSTMPGQYGLPGRALRGPFSYIGFEGSEKDTPQSDGTYSPPPGNNPDGVLAVQFAKQQLGEPYAINGDGPDQWDCSGLTAAAYNVGVPGGAQKYGLISYSTDQANRLSIVSRRISGTPGDGGMPDIPDNFSVGDILYFTNTPYPQSYKHVSLYAGNGQVIEAGDPVQMNPLNNDFNRKYFTFGGTPIPKFAGGFISGPGGPRSDMIPAMLSNGEYVVKASSVSKYGKGFMDQLNAGAFNPFQGSSLEPRMFADGGMVGSAPMPAFNMPEMAGASIGLNSNNFGGNSSSNNNSTNVKIVINGSGGKSANSIANKVISMINSANNRRNHSRSI